MFCDLGFSDFLVVLRWILYFGFYFLKVSVMFLFNLIYNYLVCVVC